MRDWLSWHEAYDDPSGSLARRLEVVKGRLSQALDGVTRRNPVLLSLCAGDGRDLLGVLSARTAEPQVAVVLVEREPTLALRATEAAAASGLTSVEVRRRDAGDPASFSDVLPVDVLLLCGIFGNIEHAAVKDLIEVIPTLVRPDGYVIWTRSGAEPDRRPEIRRWFAAAGLEEVAFDGAPEHFGVGLNQRRSCLAPGRQRLPERLFSFLQPNDS